MTVYTTKPVFIVYMIFPAEYDFYHGRALGPFTAFQWSGKSANFSEKNKLLLKIAARFTTIGSLAGRKQSRHMLIQHSDKSYALSEGTLCIILTHDS